MKFTAMLRNLWNKESSEQAVSSNPPQKEPLGNVIPLPTQYMESISEETPFVKQSQIQEPNAKSPIQVNGMLDCPELKTFSEDNYFGLGRHNGANYRSHEALELGKRSLITRFHNIVASLIARRQKKIYELKRELIAVEGVSTTMAAQLRFAIENLQNEIAFLEHQVELSDSGQGWILEALNRYQIGFNKGLREALEFDLLAR